jgi:cystathionine beta-lyase/cystathionine gamma-synthase
MKRRKSIETILSHAGLCSDPATGAISTPIYQTATFGHPRLGESTGFDYSRTSNPTRLVLERMLADLEQGNRAYAFSSGMAAITSLMTLFKPGDKVLVSDDLYGGTYRLFEKTFKPWNLNAEFVDFSDLAAVEQSLDRNVKAFFIETPTNPLMKITDLKKAAKLACTHDALVIVDNTFMTPYCQRPIPLGADIVVHSGTKYLSGHNDTLAGVVVAKTAGLAAKIGFIQNATGAVLAPFDSWLVLRGLKTLAVRMDRSQENAATVAAWLTKRKGVRTVYFPGLSGHPGQRIHKTQSSGPGAIISFRVAGPAVVKKIINRVKTITFAESLGGVESLITYPISQTHADICAAMRDRIGVTDDLLRLSIGIESCDDLIADLDQAIG